MIDQCRFCAAAAAMFVFCGSASAVTFRFGGVSKNNDNNTGSGEQQLTLDVFDSTGGERDESYSNFVTFKIENTGSADSSVTRVLFDDLVENGGLNRTFGPVLQGLNALENGPGVSFVQSFSMENLPGDEGWTTDFGFVAGEIGREVDPLGIEPGEFLMLEFELVGGLTFEDLIAAMAAGDLRIGLITEFPDGSIESFANFPNPVIPLPTGAAMGLAGLGLLAARRRRR